MEQNSTAEQSAPESLTDCGICLSTMEEPKALLCLHTFCLVCLKGYIERETELKPDVIKCPICCEDTPLRQPEGVDGLRNNFIVSDLIEKRNPRIDCTGCGKQDRSAVGRCMDCKDFLCQKCWDSHKEMRVFQTHQLCTMDDIRAGKVEGYATKHTGQVVWFSCKTCGVEHSQADHDYTTILTTANDNENPESDNAKSTRATDEATMVRRVNRKDVGIWLLLREFGKEGMGQLQRGAGITIAPNGEIAVADKIAAQVKIYSSDGVYKHSLNTKHSFARLNTTKKAVSLPTSAMMNKTKQHEVPSSPHNIVVNKKGEYFVTDMSHYVKVFDMQGMYKYHFSGISTEGITSESNAVPLEGLAQDAEGNLLVGATGNTDWYISKHEPDGTHVVSVNVRIRPSYLATLHDGKIVISSQKGVQILDKVGQLLHTLNAPPGVTLWNTAGVCSTKGIVFVSNYLGDAMAIYCFSVAGKYLGCATREVRSPKGLAITDDGKKLLCVDNNGKKVKEFVLKPMP